MPSLDSIAPPLGDGAGVRRAGTRGCDWAATGPGANARASLAADAAVGRLGFPLRITSRGAHYMRIEAR